MKQGLFLLIMLLLAGCYSTPTPTPYPLQQYPATWTPAPTPTNTPPGPTATLVIQRTPGAISTRDPNMRLLPNAPRNGIGLWLEINAASSQAVKNLTPLAQILVTDDAGTTVRQGNPFLYVSAKTISETENLPPNFHGAVLDSSTAAPEELSALHDALKPRALLLAVPVSDTARAQTIAANIDGFQLDNFLRAPNAPLQQFPDEATWKRDVDALAALSSNPAFVVLTSTRFPDNTKIDALLMEQWSNYALTSFLLGGNNSRAFFGLPDFHTQQYVNIPSLNANLGTPVGSAVKTNNVYQRRFAHGLVLVNPSAETRRVPLSQPYTDPNGNEVQQMEMLPHTGIVLTNKP